MHFKKILVIILLHMQVWLALLQVKGSQWKISLDSSNRNPFYQDNLHLNLFSVNVLSSSLITQESSELCFAEYQHLETL